jgi:hypothetical protein
MIASIKPYEIRKAPKQVDGYSFYHEKKSNDREAGLGISLDLTFGPYLTTTVVIVAHDWRLSLSVPVLPEPHFYN